ncbi:kinesin-like protein KIF22 isoform X2 [Mobula hypostoma]|uniref:kinesin-like protein KIF22 isoform X2 n=1 Tax=Mobula hypostoma TaxID=723540 RepID=UPI002FC38EF2
MSLPAELAADSKRPIGCEEADVGANRLAMGSRAATGEEHPARKSPTRQVQVVVRLRPCLGDAQGEQQQPCVRGVDTRTLEILSKRNRAETMQYQFDAFYEEDSSQQEVYVGSVRPVLAHVLNGQNASIFAYGPTGAGKTHTMLGNPEQPGIVPRALLDIFRMSREQCNQLGGPEWTFSISMSYLEIYQEKVLDLLETRNVDLPIREDRYKNIFIPKLKQQTINNFTEFELHFLPALQNRTTASTKLNLHSSRSHSVLLIKVVKMERTDPFRQLTGKLYLIDLAGSEDNRRTGNEGVRKVVDALNQGLTRIPYRDSKLTRLLQDSLGGTAHSVMITNIAPEIKHYFNTLTALNFAAKSKLIINHPFTRETIQPIGVRPLKRHQQADPSEEAAKVFKPDDSENAGGSGGLPLSPLLKPGELNSEAFGPDVMERLSKLENLLRTQGRSGLPLLGTPKAERQELLRKLEESRRQIQLLERRQQELEKVISAQETTGIGDGLLPSGKDPILHKSSVAKKRNQAIVTPLQRIDNTECLQTGDVLVLKHKDNAKEEQGGGAELLLDVQLAEQQKEQILALLNEGSLRQLKTLQRVGDKTAQLILGWRERHGPYSQIEDLAKIGMSAKFLSTFMKANALSCLAK